MHPILSIYRSRIHIYASHYLFGHSLSVNNRPRQQCTATASLASATYTVSPAYPQAFTISIHHHCSPYSALASCHRLRFSPGRFGPISLIVAFSRLTPVSLVQLSDTALSFSIYLFGPGICLLREEGQQPRARYQLSWTNSVGAPIQGAYAQFPSNSSTRTGS
ncbi:hypothetical protein FA13DRAFT_1783556, partial [Coprinellus micaceus]